MRSDGELLTDYSKQGSEEAFAELVRRHGPMVEAACRRRLGSDAEDAFQAVFVLLARKARQLAARRELGPWLHRACGFVARSVVRESNRRRHHEKEAGDMREASLPGARGSCIEKSEAAAHVDDAVANLPKRFRRVVVLCYLEGATQEQAAERLKVPLGTVAWRCSRGLEKLRARLRKRGVTLGATALGSLLLEGASHASQSFTLLPSAMAAPKIAAAGASAGTVSLSLTVAEGAIKMMFWAKMTKLGFAAAAALVAIGCAGAPVVMSSMCAPQSHKPTIKGMWVVEAPPLQLPKAGAKQPVTSRTRKQEEANLVLRLRCTAIKPIGKQKKYTLEILKVIKGEEFSGPIEVTVPGRKPGTLDFVSAPLESGSVKLDDRLRELLAQAKPGFEFDVAMDLEESVTFDIPATERHLTTSTSNFGYDAMWRGDRLVSIHRFPLGKWSRKPGSSARIMMPANRPDPFAREGVERIHTEVLKKLRAQEANYLTKELALDAAYERYARGGGEQVLSAISRTISEMNRTRDSLRHNVERALQDALGASYSRPVSAGSMIISEKGVIKEAKFSVDGVNRPLREYVTKIGTKYIAADDRLADLQISIDTEQMPVRELAALLADRVNGRAVRRGKIWHIVPREEEPRKRF